MGPFRSRSWAARAVGVAAIAALAGVGGVIPGPAAAMEHEDGILPPGDWTEDQAAYLFDLVHRTEQALPAFSDADSLAALGFHDFGVTAPGGYVHYINPQWIDDDKILDPEHPESLVFQYGQLVSAMFILPSSYDTSSIPEDIAWLPGWHTHSDICTTGDYRFAGFTAIDGTCPPGSRAWDKPPMMHVWIVDNPCGHRFGGIDTGGLECDVSHGHGGHDMGDDMGHGDMGHGDMGHGDMGHGDMGHGDGMDHGGMGDSGSGDGHQETGVTPTAPPAQPVTADPTFTG